MDETGHRPPRVWGEEALSRMKTYASSAAERGCYCRLWDTQSEVLLGQGLPEGFCGRCMKCDAPGHTRHFPGPVPFTGAWCERHYRLLFVTDPRTGSGLVVWLVVIAAIVFLVRAM